MGLPLFLPQSLMGAAMTQPPAGYVLKWSDEFEGDALDPDKWDFRTDSKMWSTQQPGNVSVSGGYLRLAVKKESAGGMQYTGAGVISKQAFRFGYYETRMKVPPGAGWHTSFWMMWHNGKGGTDTAQACQELDVIENDSLHKHKYGVNVHQWKRDHFCLGRKDIETPDLSADFHVFGCEFAADSVKYYFDGDLVQSVDLARAVKGDGTPVVFETGRQHIWLTTIATYLGDTKAVDDSTLPSAALFDYVRFYERK